MKTIEEIKNEVAKDNLDLNWDELYDEVKINFIEQIATEYAQQYCDEQIKACAYEYVKPFSGMQTERVLVILNTPNLVTTK